MYKKLLIIIPAYNEAGSIKQVINDCRRYVAGAKIVVVNDGSTDRTAEIGLELGVVVISLPVNSGIGVGVQTGLKYAVENNFLYAIQVDGDGQHRPVDIPQMFLRLKQSKVDVMIGSRYLNNTGYSAQFLRRVGIVIFSVAIKMLTGELIKDTTSGFRLYNKKAVRFLAVNYPSSFPEPESLVLLIKNHFKIMEFSVEMKERSVGRSSVSIIKGLYFFVSNIVAMIAQTPIPFRKKAYE